MVFRVPFLLQCVAGVRDDVALGTAHHTDEYREDEPEPATRAMIVAIAATTRSPRRSLLSVAGRFDGASADIGA